MSDFDKLFRNVVAAQFNVTDKASDEWLRAAVRGAIQDGRVQRVMEASHYRIAGTNIGWVAVPTDGFTEVCERVVRGLYWWQFGTALPPDTDVVARLTDEYPSQTSSLYPLWEMREIAGGQFRYAFIRDPSDHHTSLWFMEFQNQVKAIVGTGEAIVKPAAD